VLTRQGLPVLDRVKLGDAEGLLKGAYILLKEKGEKPDIVLIATGSEVHLTLSAQKSLAEDGVDARVVSMPSWELFEQQSQTYQDSVLPPEISSRLAVEAGSSFGWNRWVGDKGAVIAIDKFGASAPAKKVFEKYGFTVENVCAKARSIINS
jgi:transketolase